MLELTPQNITFVIGIIGVIFTVYNNFKNPQIKNDLETVTLRGEIATLKTEVKDIKETHLRTLEGKIETLNLTISTLSNTVIKLATIIDERIPKGSGSLTPPGQ